MAKRITIICNMERKEFFFSTDHCQLARNGAILPEGDLDSWVPVSGELPIQVVPRPSLPDGEVDTLEKYLMIFHEGEKEIANPDSRFKPEWR
jgi:hypothetical protein